MPYEVVVADNFERRDASHDRSEGWFPTEEAAIERARLIIDRAIRKSDFSAMTPRDLYLHFCDYGKAAYVRAAEGHPATGFDPWAYAKASCAQIAGKPGRS